MLCPLNKMVSEHNSIKLLLDTSGDPLLSETAAPLVNNLSIIHTWPHGHAQEHQGAPVVSATQHGPWPIDAMLVCTA